MSSTVFSLKKIIKTRKEMPLCSPSTEDVVPCHVPTRGESKQKNRGEGRKGREKAQPYMPWGHTPHCADGTTVGSRAHSKVSDLKNIVLSGKLE